MLGTIMAGERLLQHHPGALGADQREEGRPRARPDARASSRKQRSVHNNYFTLPVLFTMLAGHFAFAYGAGRAWLVLIVIMLLGVLARVFFNLRHQGRTIWALPVLGAVGVVLLAVAISPDDSAGGAGTATVAFAQVAPVIAQRCAPCHAQSPTEPGFSSPPAGLVLETPAADRGAGRRHQERRLHEGDAARQPHGHDERRARPRRRLGHPGRVDREGRRDDADDHRRRLLVHRPARGGGRAGDGRGVPAAAAARVAHHPRALERRGGLDPVRRPRPRARPRERDLLPAPRARSSSTRAASPRRRSCSPTATSASPRRPAQLAGNHFATVVEGNENLRPLAKKFLWEGAQEIAFREE